MAIINPPAWSIEKGEKNALNILLNAFRIAINGALSVFGMVDGFVDEFEDETGIDTANSENESYDASGDFYQPALVADGDDEYNTLLLHFDGSDASTTITDDSPIEHTVTAIGNAQLDTAQKKFGSAALLLDGTGDYARVPDHAGFDFGTGDFTVDCWVRFNSGSGTQAIWGQGGDSVNASRFFYDWSNSRWEIDIYTGNSHILQNTFADTITTGVWYHVAVTRSGNSWRIFRDGVQKGSTVTGSITYPNYGSYFQIGAETVAFGGMYLNGWIDEFRITKGLARWTSDFTPPSSAYSTGIRQDMALISEPQTAEVEPKTARIVLFEEDVDAVTLNTDLKAYASRDDGTTWTQITLSDEGDYGSGRRILTGQAGITAQPSGTSMRYKIETDNAKELKLHGVALTWD